MNRCMWPSRFRHTSHGLLCAGIVSFLSLPVTAAVDVQDFRFKLLEQTAVNKGTIRVIAKLRDATPLAPQRKFDHARRRAAVAQVQDEVLTAIGARGVRVGRKPRLLNSLVLEVDAPALRALARHPNVEQVQQDYAVPPALDTSVPQVGVDHAWDARYDGRGHAVAVLDTGVDAAHPMFAGKIAAEACFSSRNLSFGAEPLCPNGLESQTGAGAAVPCAGSISGCFHGTHVAGIAVGNSESLSGVARGADLFAVQIFSKVTDSIANNFLCTSFGVASPCILSFSSDQILALDWVLQQAAQHAVAAVNMSIGGGRYTSQSQCDADNPVVKLAIDDLRAVGVATVISAGNSSYINALSAPGCISSAISVGAVNDADSVASFSNSASFLSLLAPGVAITSALPGGGTVNANGTSMAAPHVAGAWAALRSMIPELSVDQILNALRAGGKTITDARNGIAVPRLQVDLSAQRYALLQPGLNLAGLTLDPAVIENTHALLSLLGDAASLDRLLRFPKGGFGINYPPYQTVFYDSNGTVAGVAAPVVAGEGYLVYAKQRLVIENTPRGDLCGPVLLPAGYSIATVNCARLGMPAFELMTLLGGSASVAAIQTFDPQTGRFQTAFFDTNGQPAGVSFPILPVQSYLFHMRAAWSGSIGP